MKILLIFVSLSLSLLAGEYDFDMDEVEPKTYEYDGYLRVDNKVQNLEQPEDKYQNYLHSEALLNFIYFYDIFRVKTSLMATNDYIKDKLNESNFPINELYIEAKINTNHSMLVGKESLQWGKGYFYNPVAFFDRNKDPLQPTQSREGYVVGKYSYNKSFNSSLKNLSFDFVFLPASESVNKDYYMLLTNENNSNNIAMRLYLLLYDTDIDFIYNYSDVVKDKVGVDFSKNIQTNFELHGEFSKQIDKGYSYL